MPLSKALDLQVLLWICLEADLQKKNMRHALQNILLDKDEKESAQCLGGQQALLKTSLHVRSPKAVGRYHFILV